MEDIKLKEDLVTAGEPATEEQVNAAKKAFIKKGLNSENLNLDNLSSQELDNLLGKAFPGIMEKCERVIAYALAERLDVENQLHEILGFKESEATAVYFDYLNGMRFKEAENAENLKAKEKDEILMFNEPEADVSMGKNIFKVDKVDHQKDLEDQEGEDLGKYKVEGIK